MIVVIYFATFLILIQTVNGSIYSLEIISYDIKRCVHNWTTGSDSFILVASKLKFLDFKILVGVILTPSPSIF